MRVLAGCFHVVSVCSRVWVAFWNLRELREREKGKRDHAYVLESTARRVGLRHMRKWEGSKAVFIGGMRVPAAPCKK